MTNNEPSQESDDPIQDREDADVRPDDDAAQLESTVDAIEQIADAGNKAPDQDGTTNLEDTVSDLQQTALFDGISPIGQAINPFGINKETDDEDLPQSIDDESSLDETHEFDNSSTNDLGTIGLSTVDLGTANPDAVDPDAVESSTVDLGNDEQTVIIPGTGKGRSPKTVSDITSETLNTEATVQLDSTNPNISEQAKTVVRQGGPESTKDGSSAAGLDHGDIGQTINPRELSDEDAAMWDSIISGSSSVEPPRDSLTRVRPAIERSITETNLQIRVRDVVTPKQSSSAASDYRLVRLLGKGGMGNVFVARQASLDRLIAVKVIKPLPQKKRDRLQKQGRLERVEADRRHQFLSEAVVTGDLDHPNIVPIHDIAVTGDDTLFYAMKRVVGTPWSKVIKEKTRSENLEILLKVCDAIAFAHTRSVVHRDIKPENIMLGDFGVVLVMDWGLALAKPDFEKIESIAHTAGLGGTPAFMAPEMARGPVESIGPASDIYLLGATLFLIVTGKAPHQAANVSQCIKAVTVNHIVDVEPKFQGELLNIALKAMATDPKQRYADVQGFQQAIREYQSHSESISLATVAQEDLESGIQKRNYTDFSRASFGFEQAISLWEGNQSAKEGLQSSKLAHAHAALDNEDFDLGLSLLDEDNVNHQPLIEQLHDGIVERDNRQSRLALFKRLAVAMLLFILVGGGIAMYLINVQRNKAINQQRIAEKQTVYANEQAGLAETQRVRAEEQADLAKKQTQLAEAKTKEVEAEKKKVEDEKRKVEAEKVRVELEKIAKERQTEIAERKTKEANDNLVTAKANEAEANKQRKLAQKQTENAQYEVYVSQIGLAKARIEGNEFDEARRILDKLRRKVGSSKLGWEWQWLWQQANQSEASSRGNSPLQDLSVSRSGQHGVAVLENGRAATITLDANGEIQQREIELPLRGKITAAAISPDGQSIALGTDGGDIELWNTPLSQRQQRLEGHSQSVTDLVFAQSGELISGSTDRTACVWNPRSGRRVTECWHIAPVRQLAVTQNARGLTVAAGVSDSSSGRAVVWEIMTQSTKPTARRVGEFLQHDRPVVSIALSADGKLAASGDIAGNVYLWRPAQLNRIDYESTIAAAVTKVAGKNGTRMPVTKNRPPFARLIDPATRVAATQFKTARLVSTRAKSKAKPSTARAHTDVVRTVRFSDDGKRLLTGADDYTVKVWDVTDRSLINTLRGHGGWVTDATFVGTDRNRILSVSKDASIRSWNTETYRDSTVLVQERAPRKRNTGASDTTIRQTRPHADEIWSARFDPGGTRIVSASRDHTARVLKVDRDTMTFTEVATLRDEEDSASDQLVEGTAFQAMSVAVDRAHGRIFVGNADSTVRIWDLVLGTQVGQVNGTGLNSHLAVSRNGRLLLTGSSSPSARAQLWGIDPDGRKSPKLIYKLKGHEEAVTAFAISPDGRTLFTGDRIGIGWLWNTQTGQRIGSALENARGFRINAASFSPNGKELWLAADDQQLTRINVATGQRIRRYAHDGFVTRLSLSADGNHAVTVSELATEKRFVSQAQLWDLRTGTQRVLDRIDTTIKAKSEARRPKRTRITSAEFGGQSDLLTVSRSANSGEPGRVKIWKMSSTNSQPTTLEVPRKLGNVQAALPLTTKHMLTLSGDAAFLWNLEKQVHEKSYRAHAALTQASFSFDGKFIATGSRSVKIWNSDTGASVGKLEYPHRGPVRSVQFSRAGPNYLLATCGDDGWARVWSWQPSESKFTQRHQYPLTTAGTDPQRLPVRCVAFSHDGKQLLVAGVSGAARVWSLANERAASSMYDVSEVGAFTSGGFSPDGKWIVLGSDDKKARLWKVAAPGKVADKPIMMEGHADQIEDVAILQNGTSPIRVMTASLDKSARIWDPRIGSSDSLGRELLTLRKHSLGVTAIDATSDGKLIMTAGRDGAVILWPAGDANTTSP